MKSLVKRLLSAQRPSNNHFRAVVKSAQPLSYQTLQPRQLLAAVDVLVGDLNSGIAVSDDASGSGYFFYSAQDVHQRFENIVAENADHLIATRLDGAQWQYNNDTNWVDFEPVATDRLLAEVNFDSNRVSPPLRSFTSGVLHSQNNGDLYFVVDNFGGSQDIGEFEVLGTSFLSQDIPSEDFDSELGQSVLRLSSLNTATLSFQREFQRFPNLAIFDESGAPLLSWRVQLLPYLGYTELYEQFRLNEAWDSPHNLSLLSEMPEVYSSPYFESDTHTNFLALAGENTLMPLVSERVGFGDIDTNGTALFVEANQNRATEWTRPRDLAFNPANPFSGLGDISPEGFSFVTNTGEVQTIDDSFSEEAWNGIVDRSDGFVVTAEILENQSFTENDLRQLGLAALNFESSRQRFPASAISSDNGEPLLSWRVSLLPFLGHQDLYDQFNLDEPWNSPNNLSLLPMMPQVYSVDGIEAGFTTYLASIGPNTLFSNEDTRGVSFGQITDGSTNTILYVKADDDQAVQWTRPADLPFDAANPRAGLGNSDVGGFLGVTAAAETIFVENSISDLDVASLLLRNDGRTIDQDVFPAKPVGDNLRQVGLASLNFESANRRFPTQAITAEDGTPLLSWRVAILPFIEQNNLYQRFNLDEPWDSPNNIALLPLIPQIYAVDGIDDGFTTILGIAGEEGLLAQGDRGVTFGQITDGTSNTALFVQANSDFATQWTKPQDIDFDPSNPTNGVGSATASGFHAVFADGSLQFIPNSVSDETVGRILQRNDGEVVDQLFFLNQQDRVLPNLEIQYQIRTIALAQLNHESANMAFTERAIFAEDGTPLLSWRVAILPFIEQNDLYEQFNLDEPWDSPNNIALLPLMPQIYAHPEVENGQTVFKIFVGDETPFQFEDSRRGISFSQITDGSSNTIMVVETASENAVPWTQPEDIIFDINDPKAGLGHGLFDSFSVALFDGSVRQVSNTISDEEFAAVVTIAGGEISDPSAFAYNNEGTVTQPAFSGTAGDDTINVNIGSGTITIDINGETSVVPAADFDDLFFDAVDGNDTLNLILETDNNQISLSPELLSIVGNVNVLAEGFKTVRVTGSVGSEGNSATINGSDGNDVLRAGSQSATLTVGDSILQAIEISDVTVNAGLGDDQATLTDSAGDDQYFAAPLISRLTMGDRSILATGFENTTARSVNGGNDRASLRDSSGDDVLSASPELTFLRGDGYRNAVLNFGNVLATSTGGNDLANFQDSAGNDFFYATPELAFFQGTGYRNQANGFTSIFAQSSTGNDRATLLGSTGNETFIGSPVSARLAGEGVVHVARGFNVVNAVGLGGEDRAFLSDSTGNDQFFASPVIGTLSGDGFRNIARGFGFVQGTASGGNDTASLIGSTGTDNYYATPELASLTGNGYRRFVTGFEQVNAVGGGGSDVARMIGSAGNDVFFGSSTFSQYSGAGFLNRANGFSEVYSFGGGGNDFATLLDSAGDDRMIANTSFTSMIGEGYLISASQFTTYNVNARNGGFDTAFFSDSDSDDFFTAEGSRATLVTPLSRFNAFNFDQVVAQSFNGGTDFLRAGETNFRLVRSGNWR